jgi:alanyl-tRNA synthetase
MRRPPAIGLRSLRKQTPFYGEAGGQAGDVGTITAPDGRGLQVDVQGTVKDPTGLIIHKGHVVTRDASPTNDPIRLR